MEDLCVVTQRLREAREKKGDPTISEKPIKSLGKLFDCSLHQEHL